jgi:hypothetical protein
MLRGIAAGKPEMDGAVAALLRVISRVRPAWAAAITMNR